MHKAEHQTRFAVLTVLSRLNDSLCLARKSEKSDLRVSRIHSTKDFELGICGTLGWTWTLEEILFTNSVF